MKEADLGEATVVVRDDGIVDFTYKDGVVVDGEAAERIVAGTRELLGEIRPHPTLIRLNRVKSVTREARTFFAESKENMEIASKIAMIAGNPIARLVANFFLGINQPPRPTKLFGDVDAATAWLLE